MTHDIQPGTALKQVIARIREENLAIARVGCMLIDLLRDAGGPTQLDDVQDLVRFGIQDANHRLRVLRRRDTRRSAHFSARARRKPALGPRIPDHIKALRVRVGLFEDRVVLLQQLADAAAWYVLGMDIRRIGPLFRPLSNALPEGVGLAGVIQLKTELHQSGLFLAIENDLTRCCKVGDLTVVRADGRLSTPLLLEVKTHAPDGRVVEGGEVGILSITANTGLTIDKETFDLFRATIRSADEGPMEVSERSERQAQEIVDTTTVVAKLLTSRGRRLSRPPSRNWDAVTRVLRRAAHIGFSYDLVEPGVCYFGCRLEGSDNAANAIQRIRDDIAALLPSSSGHKAALSHQIAQYPSISGAVLPIAHWQLPLDLRAQVLAGRLLFGVFMDADLISRLFAERNVRFRPTGEGWQLGEDPDPWIVPTREVFAIELGMVFAGTSPASIVDLLVEAIPK